MEFHSNSDERDNWESVAGSVVQAAETVKFDDFKGQGSSVKAAGAFVVTVLSLLGCGLVESISGIIILFPGLTKKGALPLPINTRPDMR